MRNQLYMIWSLNVRTHSMAVDRRRRP